MFTSSTGQLRDDRTAIWPAILGVVLIVGLLWAFGSVVQDHVVRAHARLAQQAPLQATVGPCAADGMGTCDPLQNVSVEQGGRGLRGAAIQPVSVVYH